MSFLPPEPVTLHGGCHCNAIRYSISIPKFEERPILGANRDQDEPKVPLPFFALDHCDDCRKVSGVPVQFWAICPPQFVTFSCLVRFKGEEGDVKPATNDARIDIIGKQAVQPSETAKNTFLSYYPSSEHVWRTFCSRCGTNLTYAHVKEGKPLSTLDILMGTLDRGDMELAGVKPERHLWWNSGIGWVKKLTSEGDSTVSTDTLPRHPRGNPYVGLGD